ncbi:hypothetical protein [Joostella sp. CR20]|uniref:hypothetical protein n=1 Tax=Joostella sp. CR20 TaxID=2804312 RepID=UPI00313E4A55
MESNIESEGKVTAIIGYLMLLGAVIAIFMNLDKQNPFARFHIRQGFGLSITFLLLGYLVGNFDSWMISSAFYLFISILWIYGFIGMLQNKYTEVPLLGKYFQQWFTFIK